MRKRNYTRTDRSTTAERRRKILLIAGIPLGVYFLISSIFGEMGLVKYYRMRAQHETIVQDIAELKKDNLRLMLEVRSLRSDPAFMEKLARDKLGMARSGEIVYYYDESGSKPENPDPH